MGFDKENILVAPFVTPRELKLMVSLAMGDIDKSKCARRSNYLRPLK